MKNVPSPLYTFFHHITRVSFLRLFNLNNLPLLLPDPPAHFCALRKHTVLRLIVHIIYPGSFFPSREIMAPSFRNPSANVNHECKQQRRECGVRGSPLGSFASQNYGSDKASLKYYPLVSKSLPRERCD